MQEDARPGAPEQLSQAEAARRLSISRRQLARLSKRGDVPRSEDGSYPWPAVRDAYERARPPERKESPRETITQAEAAQRIGITSRHLRRLTEEGKVSRNPDGKYSWPQVDQEYRAWQVIASAAGGTTLDLKVEQARLTKEKADAQAMQNARDRGELLAATDVERLLREPLEKVNTVAKGLTSRYAPRLAKAAGIPLAEAKRIMGDIGESIREQLRNGSG